MLGTIIEKVNPVNGEEIKYLIEFCDDNGKTIEMTWLSRKDFKIYNNNEAN